MKAWSSQNLQNYVSLSSAHPSGWGGGGGLNTSSCQSLPGPKLHLAAAGGGVGAGAIPAYLTSGPTGKRDSTVPGALIPPCSSPRALGALNNPQKDRVPTACLVLGSGGGDGLQWLPLEVASLQEFSCLVLTLWSVGSSWVSLPSFHVYLPAFRTLLPLGVHYTQNLPVIIFPNYAGSPITQKTPS